MKTIVIAAVAAVGVMAAGVASAQEDLAQKSGCMTCHALDAKKMGPSYKEIAAKYKGKAGADATLVANLVAGKDHKAVKSSEADTKAIVKWILAQ